MCRDDTMLTTPLCSLFNIEVPIILAPMGSCNLGRVRGRDFQRRWIGQHRHAVPQLRRLRARYRYGATAHPAAFRNQSHSADRRYRSISLHADGAPDGNLIRARRPWRFGAAGVRRRRARVMVQVTTVDQASQAAERGADVISAQGSESGGYCGEVSTMTLVPQVVDAVAPIPVVASGGIFDGHGIAAALVLGAAGVNLGTRFIASKEAPTPQEWKEAIVNARSEHAIKAEVLNDISPLPGTAGFTTVLRSLPTEFLAEWSG